MITSIAELLSQKRRKLILNLTDATCVVKTVIHHNMRKVTLALLLLALSLGCQKDESTSNLSGGSSNSACGTYKSGQKLYKGPEGGCYYINSNGNKTYVEREACKC